MQKYLHLFIFIFIVSLYSIKASNDVKVDFSTDNWIKTNIKFFEQKLEKNLTSNTNYDFQPFKDKLTNNSFTIDEKIELCTFIINKSAFRKAENDFKQILITLIIKYDTKFYTTPFYTLNNTQITDFINKALLAENDNYITDKNNKKTTTTNDDDFITKAYNHDTPIVVYDREKEELQNKINFISFLKESLIKENDTFIKVQSFFEKFK